MGLILEMYKMEEEKKKNVFDKHIHVGGGDDSGFQAFRLD